MTKDHPPHDGVALPYRGQTTNLISYSGALAKEKGIDDFLASITARSPCKLQ